MGVSEREGENSGNELIEADQSTEPDKEPRFTGAFLWLCPSYVLHGTPKRLMQTTFDIYLSLITLQHPTPAQVIL